MTLPTESSSVDQIAADLAFKRLALAIKSARTRPRARRAGGGVARNIIPSLLLLIRVQRLFKLSWQRSVFCTKTSFLAALRGLNNVFLCPRAWWPERLFILGLRVILLKPVNLANRLPSSLMGSA